MIYKKIDQLKQQLQELHAENEEALEALRIKYLSKKGEITALFNDSPPRAKERVRPEA